MSSHSPLLNPGSSPLPETLPVFPLSGVVLLPQARLPLNIFEPRYLTLIQDVLAKPMRLMGIIQPNDHDQPNNMVPRLFQVGCAGKITSFNETEDGRFLITLTGICRFGVRHELDATTPYRIVTPDWETYIGDLTPSKEEEIDRKRLLIALKHYFKTHEISADWNAVQNTPNDSLISSLIMICPLAPNEKQALLETATLQARADMLMTLLEMAVFPQNDGEGDIKH